MLDLDIFCTLLVIRCLVNLTKEDVMNFKIVEIVAENYKLRILNENCIRKRELRRINYRNVTQFSLKSM